MRWRTVRALDASSGATPRGHRIQRGKAALPNAFGPDFARDQAAPAYSWRRMPLMTAEVSPEEGQHVEPPGGVMPISRWGPEEMPTRPQPTSATGWPASTCAPTGTSAGAA